jgi:hypothetical protein
METTGAVSWRKSSYSSSNGGNCVEVGTATHNIAVRDSKDPHGPVIAFSSADWQTFTERLRQPLRFPDPRSGE